MTTPDDREIQRWHRMRHAMTADPGPDRAPADRLLVIAAALFARFEQTQDGADLAAAIEAGHQAAAVIAPHHPDRAGVLMFLGACLGLRYERLGDLADLDDAVRVAQQAVAATPPDHRELPGYLTVLAATTLTRFERTKDPADLHDAIRAGQLALTATLPGHPDRTTYEVVLQSALNAQPVEAPRVSHPDEPSPDAAQAATEPESDHLQ